MTTLNTIEKKLKEKSIKELNVVIDEFEAKLDQLFDTYGGCRWYSFDPDIVTSVMNPDEFRRQLRYSLQKRFLDKMISKKSTELLDKLEIL
jgi:hypothetical protein